MHPHRVHCLVIDGVVDSKDYYSSMLGEELVDADSIMDKFAEYCYAAGPETCAMFTGKSPSDITSAINKVVADLYKAPLVAHMSDIEPPEILTHSDLMRYVFRTLYTPYQSFPELAEIFADLRAKNGSLLGHWKRRNPTSSCPSAECRREGPYGPDCLDPSGLVEEAGAAVACTDGIHGRDLTKEQVRSQVKVFMGKSRWIGGTYASIFSGLCNNWKARAACKFDGMCVRVYSNF